MTRRAKAAIICAVAALALAGGLVFFLRGGAIRVEDPSPAGRPARISPDYSGVVIPPNIAPMNFTVNEPGDAFVVEVAAPRGESFRVAGTSPGMAFPAAKWRKLLEANRGGSMEFRVFVRGRDGRWSGFKPIVNRVASEEIDRYLVYRVLPKYNRHQSDIRICQRDVTGFGEVQLMHSAAVNNGCMNCHTFVKNDPSLMVMHVRTAGGGMLVARNGVVTKVDTRTAFNPDPAKYMSIHPSGKAAAFSTNEFWEFTHAAGEPVDVYDLRSSVALYLFDSNTVTTTPELASPDRFETYPAWSPDGRFLYYCSAPRLPRARWREVRYDLMRIGYDADTGAWGKAEIVLSAAQAAHSVTQPRISPDGKFLLFCVSDHGSFPVMQPDADLCLMDLATLAWRRLAMNSDYSESWHSWSSNGRWIVFSSRRRDGAVAKLYFSHVDASGEVSAPLLLPQEDPGFYDAFLKTYNVPELATGPVRVTERQLVEAVRSAPAIQAKLDPAVTIRPPAEPPAPQTAPQPYRVE